MLASYYVINDILDKWGKVDEVEKELEKFSLRYPQDQELLEIYQEFKEGVEKKGDLDKIKGKLENLERVRKIDSSGGSKDLPYSDRRHLNE